MGCLQHNIFMTKCLLQMSVALLGSLVKAKNSLTVIRYKVRLSVRGSALWFLVEEGLSSSW